MRQEPLGPPNAPDALPLKCPSPTCDASSADLLVRSTTVVTLRCATCQLAWSVSISDLPTAVRQHLDALPPVQ